MPLSEPPGSGPEMRLRAVTRRPRATVRSRRSRAAPGTARRHYDLPRRLADG